MHNYAAVLGNLGSFEGCCAPVWGWAGGCWRWSNLCLERLVGSDLPVASHLPNLTHRLISVASFSKTIQQELAHPTYLSRRPQASPSQLSFSPGSFSHPDLLPWQGQWAWHYWQTPHQTSHKKVPALCPTKSVHIVSCQIFSYTRTIKAANMP